MKSLFKKSMCVVIALLISLVALVGLSACDGKAGDGEFEMATGTRPDLANRITSEELELINSAMLENADKELQKQAVIKLYEIANSSRIEDGNSLMLQETFMGICNLFSHPRPDMQLEDAMAVVKMRGFTLKSDKDWYNQFVAQLQGEANLMAFFTTMAKVNYHLESAPDDYYFNIMKGVQIEADCSLERFPYASFKLTEEHKRYDLDGFKNAANVLTAPNEIYNMDFMTDIIFDGDISIKHEDGVYKVHFSIDTAADKEKLEQWYRLPQKDMQEGNQTINAYLRYLCDFEVWDNGYAKCFAADYVRDAGNGSGITIDKFNYLWNEDEIKEVISDDYRLDHLSKLELDMMSLDDYIAFYIGVEPTFPTLYIALIVVGCVVFAAIVAVIVVEILVRKGKLPKLAAKREAAKQKRLAKKAAKKGLTAETSPDDNEGGDGEATSQSEEASSEDQKTDKEGSDTDEEESQLANPSQDDNEQTSPSDEKPEEEADASDDDEGDEG